MPKKMLKVRAPAWPEKTSKFILEKMRKLEARFDESCRFCNINEEPVVENIPESGSFRVLESRFPYLPQHVIITHKEHVASIHELDFNEFAEFGKTVKKVFRAAKKEGVSLSANGNTGLIAGQTIPHLHIHLFPREVKLEEGMPLYELRKGAEFFDPLALPILHYLKSKGSLPENAVIPKRGEGIPALALHFSSFDELFSKKGFESLQQAFAETQAAFEHLKRNPEDAVLPPGYKKEFGKQIVKLLRERTTQGFGVNWSIREAEDGGVELLVLPRATAIDLKDAKKRIAALELFANVKLHRGGLKPEEEKEWDAREKKFKNLVRKALE
jgi:histidine triad (HIT) family protein